MTYGIESPLDFLPAERPRLAFPPLILRLAPGAAMLAMSGMLGLWTLYIRPLDAPRSVEAATPPAQPAAASVAAGNPYGDLLNPRLAAGPAASQLGQNFPLQASLETPPAAPGMTAALESAAPEAPQPGDVAPLPVPRPADLAPPPARIGPNPLSRRLAQQAPRATAPADNRGFLEKLFSFAQPAAQAPAQPARQVLAYAAPEDSAVGNALRLPALPAPSPAPRADGATAIYDVAAHTVYMPNGERLEAHSGLGPLIDDPRYVHEKNRGATPPNVYALSLREELFHGVPALRLTPVGSNGVYGRTGLLAHTYMLGPRGDSNGCVSFRNYGAFLQAYQKGQVQRLLVVARSN